VVDNCGQGEDADYLCLMPTSTDWGGGGGLGLCTIMITDWIFGAGLPDFTKHANNAEDANNVDFDDNLEIHRYVSIYRKQPK
jgi:hypothetical protein